MRWPSPEDELLATCARLEFGEFERMKLVELCQRHVIRWNQVYSTARLHGVAPLVYRNLAQLDPDNLGLENGTLERFRRSFARNLAWTRYLQEGIWSVLGFFNGHRLDVMLIKGAAIGLVGSSSVPYTVSRDVDLIVRARRVDLPDKLVTQLFEMSQTFPMEHDFFGHHDVDLNGVLPIDWDRVWADAIPVHYAGRDFYIMSPEDSLIAACINACRKRYFNLKALSALDAHLKNGGTIEWDLLAEKSGAYQVGDLIYTALTVTSSVMSSPVPEDLATRLRTSTFRKALLDLLSVNLSFSSLWSLYSGTELGKRRIGNSLLLPYVSYRIDQVWRKLRFAVGSLL